MPRYVDGFVLPVQRSRLGEYTRIAEEAARIWKEYGALEYWECLGDDLNIEGTRAFPDLVAASEDETVVFAWIVFESRRARDDANRRILADPRIAALMDGSNPVFDVARMAYGGFSELVHSSESDAREG